MEFIASPLSQADVPGAEEACTSIAVVACASALMDDQQMDMELWIRQGGAIHQVWQQTRRPSNYALVTEVVPLVKVAWNICMGDEFGGHLWIPGEMPSLAQCLDQLPLDSVSVLTIGAFSVALLRGALWLFDSHAPEAGLFQFQSRQHLLHHLQ